MTETQRIADQLKRAVWGEAWHGPGVHEVLKEITAGQALAKPIPNAHSIWELTLHITVWAEIVSLRLMGGQRWVDVEPWPPVHETGQAAWDAARQAVMQSHGRLAEQIAALEEARLSDTMPGDPPTIYIQLHGAVQHSLYHLGQITLLKKAQVMT